MTSDDPDLQDGLINRIEDAPEPGDGFDLAEYINYTARLLYESGEEHDDVSDALFELEANPRKQIALSADVQSAHESREPERAEAISDLEHSGASYIRSCRIAAVALHGEIDADTNRGGSA